jgi:hypothetical protein
MTELSVYDGRERIGGIREKPDGSCVTTTATGILLGTFHNRAEACAAIGRHHAAALAARVA